MYYMVMEYIAGSDLAQLLAEHASLPLAQVRPLLRDVAAALDYAHAQGLVHRDVKPSNVMIQAANTAGVGQRAILTDFGIAKILTDAGAATRTGVMIGTPDYRRPSRFAPPARSTPAPTSMRWVFCCSRC